jgi:LPS-assembly protein
MALSASAEDYANISADHMEYHSESNTYKARGSVIVTFGDATMTADEMQMDAHTYDAVAVGNVTYSDPEAIITYVFYKKNNFHLHSEEISKIGDRSFFLENATVTTCDASSPEWHISGEDISITQNESMNGRRGRFKIKNTSVLYAPYFWAPLNNDRHTGFLIPTAGYSSKRGYFYKQGFFWAIKENQDAALYLDYYTKKGLGAGLDYRYILSENMDGEFWLYGVGDKDPSRNLYEIKSYHNQKLPYDIDGHLKLHLVSHYDYYETMDSTSKDRFGLSTWDSYRFGLASQERYQKYLQSNLQVSKSFSGGRSYLLAQGRQSLEGSSEAIPQYLPEIAFILNTRSKKFFSYNFTAKGVNFWREKEQEGIRLDLNPDLFFSYGRIFNITQRVGLRETVYFLNDPKEYDNRFIYELDTTLTTALFRKFSSLVHIIEPFLQYTYIPDVDQDEAPIFDSTDFIPERSNITYALTNRVSGIGSNFMEARFRLSQSYSFLREDKEFSPIVAEATMASSRVDFSANASYDVYETYFTEFIGTIRLKAAKGYIGFGKSFRRSTDLDQYSFEAGIHRPIKIINTYLPIDLEGRLWYDVENKRVQGMDVRYRYTRQCWGYSITYIKSSDDYRINFSVELMGLGGFGSGTDIL